MRELSKRAGGRKKRGKTMREKTLGGRVPPIARGGTPPHKQEGGGGGRRGGMCPSRRRSKRRRRVLLLGEGVTLKTSARSSRLRRSGERGPQAEFPIHMLFSLSEKKKGGEGEAPGNGFGEILYPFRGNPCASRKKRERV